MPTPTSAGTSLLLVSDTLVLIRAAVEDASSARVALKPGLSDLELAAAFDCTHAMATPGVLRHVFLQMTSLGSVAV